MAPTRPRITLVILGINTNEEIRPWIALARALIYSKNRVICNIITHEQFSPMLADAGVGFLDGGMCPFYARNHTHEGKKLDSKTQPYNKPGHDVTVVPQEDSAEGLEGFMGAVVRSWFEAGLTAFQDSSCDLAILCGSTSLYIYTSICEMLGICFALADDVPVVENSLLGPPRGFVGDLATNREQPVEDRARQWRVHAESMWGCLFAHEVNECRRKLTVVPCDEPHGCTRLGKTAEGPTRIALLDHGKNGCSLCAETNSFHTNLYNTEIFYGCERPNCRSGKGLPPIEHRRGPDLETSECSALGKGKPVPFLLFYSTHLVERIREWGKHVIVAGPLFDADEALRFLPNPTDMLERVHTSEIKRCCSGTDDIDDTISSLSSGSDQTPRPKRLALKIEESDEVVGWKFPPRSNSEITSLIPQDLHRFIFRRVQGGAPANSNLTALSALNTSTLRPTIYVDFGANFSTWATPATRGLVLLQCVRAARETNCRLILVADSSVALPFNLLSQHPSVKWTEDRSSISKISSSHQSMHIHGDLGALVRVECEDVMVIKRSVGSCTSGNSRSAAIAVATLSRCSGVLGRPSPWLIHAAALAGTAVTSVDFSRSDSADSFWASQLHHLKLSPVKPIMAHHQESGAKGLSGHALRRAFELLHDPSSHVRCMARELSAMMRAGPGDSLNCTFVDYVMAKRSKKEVEEEGEDSMTESPLTGRVGILGNFHNGSPSKSPSRLLGAAEVNKEFRCLTSAVKAVLDLALPIASRNSRSSRTSRSPEKRPSSSSHARQQNAYPRSDRRYSPSEQSPHIGQRPSTSGSQLRGKSPLKRPSSNSKQAKL